jgi:DnaK suppressor protein
MNMKEDNYAEQRQQLELLAIEFAQRTPRRKDHALTEPDEQTDSQIDLTLRGMATGRYGQVLEALQRLKNGTYGTCGQCGVEISRQRLEIIPEALYCVDCQRGSEQRVDAPMNTVDDLFDQLS